VFEVEEGRDFPLINKEYREASVKEINAYFETFGCEPPKFYSGKYKTLYKKWTDSKGNWKKK
jgi:hypothetical protein